MLIQKINKYRKGNSYLPTLEIEINNFFTTLSIL